MKRLQALIFNFDGTLADTAQTWRNAFNLSFADHGLPCWFDDSVSARRYFRSSRETEWISRIGKRHMLDSHTIQSVLDLRDQHFNSMASSGLVPMRADTKSLIQLASANNIRIAIATMAQRDPVVSVIENSMGPQALNTFAAIQCHSRGEASKPDPQIYTSLIERLGVSPLDCIAVESSAPGMTAAYHAGIYTIGLKNRLKGAEHLQHGDMTIGSLAISAGQLLVAAGGPKAPPQVLELAAILQTG